MRIESVVASMFVLGIAAVHASPAVAASANQSANCPGGQCAVFESDDTIPVIKSYTITLPSSGGAVAYTFGGSMYCAASGSPIQDRVVDFASAITTSASPTAIPTTVSSFLRHATVLKDEDDHIFDTSTTFNLQTTRVIKYTTAGPHTVYYRIARARQDTNTICYVNGGSFTSIATP